jgi:DNA-binding transcriptional ArsR family regulator
MDQFAAPAVSLLGIFPRMMIRRIDLAMFAAAFDIGDKQKIFFPAAEIGTPRVSGKVLRSLIHFAWTLEPDRIIISDEIGQAVRHEAFRLAQKFGGTADLPIVMDEDFRLAVARLSASYAVLSLASPDDLTTIVVTAEHVEAVGRFLDLIYSADNCRLDAYAAGYRERHGVADYDEFLESVRGWVEAAKAGDEPAGRKLLILAALRRVSWDGSAIKVSELADELDLDRKTLQRDMALLYKFHLTEQAKSGIRPTGKFNRFARLLEADMPGFLAERTQEEV